MANIQNTLRSARGELLSEDKRKSQSLLGGREAESAAAVRSNYSQALMEHQERQ
jgi:hypothetical protein